MQDPLIVVSLISMRGPNFNVILIYFVLFYILLHSFPFPFYLFYFFPEISYGPLVSLKGGHIENCITSLLDPVVITDQQLLFY